MRQSLRKHEILRGHGSFSQIFKKGILLKSGPLRCTVVITPGSSGSPLQIGFSVRAKKAVERNRLRRLIKESARLHKAPLQRQLAAHDKSASMVLGMRSDGVEPAFAQVEKDVQAIFEQIIHRWLT